MPSRPPSLRARSLALLRKFLDSQIRLSYLVERRLSSDLTTDGYSDFAARIVPAYLKPAQVVYDIGGGKRPFVSAALKAALGLTIVGVDISGSELERAP